VTFWSRHPESGQLVDMGLDALLVPTGVAAVEQVLHSHACGGSVGKRELQSHCHLSCYLAFLEKEFRDIIIAANNR